MTEHPPDHVHNADERTFLADVASEPTLALNLPNGFK